MQDSRENVCRAYEAFAVTYDRQRGQFDLDAVLNEFLAVLPGRGALLDLGCGAGEPVARTFIERGWTVTGVDFSGAMLELAAQTCPAMQRIQADMRAVEFPPGHFDAISLVYSLFHLPWREHPALFARLCHWLKPSGRLLFTYATADYTGQEQFEGDKLFMGQRLFYSHTTEAELTAQLAVAGLVIEQADRREIGGERFLWVTARRADAVIHPNSKLVTP